MRGLKCLIKWSSKYLILIILVLFLSFLLQYTLSFISLTVSYVFKILEGNDPTEVNLPSYVLKIFSSFDKPFEILVAAGLFIIVLQIFRSVLRYITNFSQSDIGNRISIDMKAKMYSYLTKLSYQYHNDSDKGDLIQRCTSDIDTASRYPSREFINFVNIFFTVGIGAYQVFLINPKLMLACISTLPITVVLSFVFYFISNKKIRHVEELEAKMITVINENVTSSRVVRAFFNEKFEFEKMDEASKTLARAQESLGRLEGIYSGLSDALIALQYALIMIVGIVLCKKNIIDSGDISACLLLTSMILWPFRGLARTIMAYGRTNVAVNRLADILDENSEYLIDGSLEPKLSGAIDFNHVSYTFKEGNQVLNDVSFNIKPGETIAIMGRTGSGKSTIANLLVRMFDISEGEILLDGVNINEIRKQYLRKNVALILQEPFLYSRSIKENLMVTKKNATMDEIRHVAKLAHIDEDISKFKDGYDTIVGEKGTTLSGGEKQRLSIARALLNPVNILIFDDSLSALDSKTDLDIRTSLNEMPNRPTTIVITHRTATAKSADKIIILENNSVAAIGTHNELKNKHGLYHDLWEIQGNLEENFLSKDGELNG